MRTKMVTSVPSGSTGSRGARSVANGLGWSSRTGGDQLAPRSVVRENDSELVLGTTSERKLAQTRSACPASAGPAGAAGGWGGRSRGRCAAGPPRLPAPGPRPAAPAVARAAGHDRGGGWVGREVG